MKSQLLLSVVLTGVNSFAPSRMSQLHRPFTTIRTQMAALDETESSEPDIQKQLADVLAGFNLDGIIGNIDKIQANTMEGEIGQRGELYTFAQFAILLCILIGGVPLIGDVLLLVLGPGLLLAGSATMVISINDLGDALTPWPVPPQGDSGLKTSGLYAQVRHPLYAGLLASMAGLSIITGSANRLLLSAVLLYSLSIKSDYEEEELMKKFPEYSSYKEKVTSKFFPSALTDVLPWGKKDKEIDTESN